MVHNNFNIIRNQLDSYLSPYQHLKQQNDYNIDTLIEEVKSIKLSRDELLAKYNILKIDYDKLTTSSPTTDNAQDIHLQYITFFKLLC